MSTYYNFYLGTKSNEIYSICGPYIFKDGKFKLKQLYATSGGFIYWDDFKEFMEHIYIKEMDPEQIKLMTNDFSWFSEKEDIRSCAYVCPLSKMIECSREKGLRQGYIPLDSFQYVKNQDYYIESIYDLDNFCSIEKVAEMDFENRKKYGKIAFMETLSVDYIANKIATAAMGIVGYEDEKDYYIICVVDY